MAVISTSAIRHVGCYIHRDKLVILQSLKGWRLGGFILTFVTWSRCVTSQISHLCFVGLYAWIIFPVLVCSWAGERENYRRTISCCRWSAFRWSELAYNSVKTSVACVIIYWALYSWRTHERKNIVLLGSNSSGFSQRLLGQVFIGLFDFQILFPPFSSQWAIVSKLVYIYFPCFVHGRCPLKRVSQISLYSCFVGSYSVFSWTLALAMATARKMLTLIDRIKKASMPIRISNTLGTMVFGVIELMRYRGLSKEHTYFT